MTAVATGPDPTATADGAPAPAAAPAQSTPVGTGSGAGGAADTFQVSRSELGGRSWHDVARDAKLYEDFAVKQGWAELARELDCTVEDVRAFVAAHRGDNPPADPSAQPDPDDQPMTVKQWRELTAQQQEAARQEQAQREQGQSLQEGRKAERAFIDQTLNAAGIKPDTVRGNIAQRILNGCIVDALKENIRPWHNAAAQKALLEGPAGPDVLTRAQQLFEQQTKDYENETIAAFSARNKDKPAATLAAGPGGGTQAPPDWDSMTPKERSAYLQAALPDKR